MRDRTSQAAWAAATAVLLGATVASAQPPGREGARARRPGMQAAADYLGLTDQQKAAFEQLREKQRPQMQALREQMRDNGKALREALEGESPDPTRVGELVIAGHQLRAKGRALRDEADKQLRAVLTPDQQVKFDAMKALRAERGPMGPGMMGFDRHRPDDDAPPEP
jgi:Spy/CpxP family protein refolding chaperone